MQEAPDEAALALLRNVHRTAVAVFTDGGKFRTDPSKVDAFTETALARSAGA